MSSLNVVALISGGKDSFFSILHCIENGHRIVALANLYPSSAAPAGLDRTAGDTMDDEDIDSYMYQTVGHSVIPLYQEALGLPVYRQEIRGGPVDTARTYTNPGGDSRGHEDETESLVPLLRRVLEAQPEVNAVSTGAILSDYQRTRVETIAVRLGLVPISYLWQFPFLPPCTRHSLLYDMAAAGQDSRIIKVASGSLGQKHLWLNVADVESVDKLIAGMPFLSELDDGGLIGEGGEYETLTIDGPSPLWKRRIDVSKDDLIKTGKSGGVFALRVSRATTVAKGNADNTKLQVRRPNVFDQEFYWSWQNAMSAARSHHPPLPHSAHKPSLAHHCLLMNVEMEEHVSDCNKLICISNLSSSSQDLDVSDQMQEILQRIETLCAGVSVSISDALHTSILLRSMDDFGSVNTVYSRLFSFPNPPSRVTIACGDLLPSGKHVSVSMIIAKARDIERTALHVQSRSYWAPANIGPYSQAQKWWDGAAREDAITYFAGQIPLVPATMHMLEGDFTCHAALALQHLWRVGKAMRTHWFCFGLAFIVASSEEEACRRADIANATWLTAQGADGTTHQHRSKPSSFSMNDWCNVADEGHTPIEPDTSPSLDDDDEQSDNFDVGNMALRSPWSQAPALSRSERAELLKTTKISLPERGRLHLSTASPKFEMSPCVVMQVDGLPRQAQIEWSTVGLNTSTRIEVGHRSDEQFEVFEAQDGGTSFTVVVVKDWTGMSATDLIDLRQQRSFCELYISKPCPKDVLNAIEPKVTPCKSIHFSGSEEVSAVLTFQRSEPTSRPEK